MKLTLFWLVVFSGFLFWIILNYDFSEAVKAFSGVDRRLICLSFFFNIGLLYFRAFKWAIILKPLNRKTSFYNMSLAAFAGCLFNMVIPARAGGLVQAWLIGTKENISISAALGTVTLVRIFDSSMLVFSGFLIIMLQSLSHTGNEYFTPVFRTMTLAGFILLFMILLLIFITRKKHTADSIIRVIIRIFPDRFKKNLKKMLTLFFKGLECMNSPWYLASGLVLSLIFWLLCGINVHILLRSFGLDFGAITPSYMILLAQAFSMGIPAPANIGPYHAATVGALSIFGIATGPALHAAVMMHGVMFCSNTLPGLVYLGIDGTGISTMIKGIKDVRQGFK